MKVRVLVASNADYDDILNGTDTVDFTAPKESSEKHGDVALVFTHEGLFARAKFMSDAKQPRGKAGFFGNRPVYRAKVGEFEILPRLLPMDHVRKRVERQSSEWRWPTHPRRSFYTPESDHAAALLKIVDRVLSKEPDRKPKGTATKPPATARVGSTADPAERRAMALRAEGVAAAEPFDPHDAQDGPRRVLASLVQRQGQGAFRDGLLRAYGGRCAITGWAVVHVLEAAHIRPYQGKHTSHVSNGLLLRSDLHALFDLHLIEIDPDTYVVRVDPSIAGTPYGKMHGRKLRLPADATRWPSAECLRQHARPRVP